MIKRKLAKKIQALAGQFPVIAVLGPRQSGKTTLVQDVFRKHAYVSLEDLDKRDFAMHDPKGFLKTFENEHGLIIDEVQHAPGLLSYIQTIVDASKQHGKFVLTGSQNLMISQQVSQTLAGRIAILTLLPLSLAELDSNKLLPADLSQMLFQGFYPRIHAQTVDPADWYSSYLQTYVERDVRQVQNVSDLALFRRFMKLCAGRVGQLLNVSSLSNDCGVSVGTVNAWLSILEASYVLFLLRPHHKNFRKRLVKSPKLYFYDVGLASHLLEIQSAKELDLHHLRGHLFESMILADLQKQRFNQGRLPNCFFWRDKTGDEVDCIIEQGERLTPVEIKVAQTLHSDFFSGLAKWSRLAQTDPSASILIYGGNEDQTRKDGHILSWRSGGYLLD
ncbi:MAG: ATP-binding protein [Chlamydiia bacterium]|nr:ATP-binding protein [Chlamydiia bacterium]MCP5492812.1 ATP-binding protein [Chlamydiales bacterium]